MLHGNGTISLCKLAFVASRACHESVIFLLKARFCRLIRIAIAFTGRYVVLALPIVALAPSGNCHRLCPAARLLFREEWSPGIFADYLLAAGAAGRQ
jgi:hypothetical protein